jgi:hypothetical protein
MLTEFWAVELFPERQYPSVPSLRVAAVTKVSLALSEVELFDVTCKKYRSLATGVETVVSSRRIDARTAQEVRLGKLVATFEIMPLTSKEEPRKSDFCKHAKGRGLGNLREEDWGI